MKNEKNFNARAQRILKNLIECYIQDGQPIASKRLAEDNDLLLSPATIRNVLSELEELGYLLSPHTSAGRVPTTRGYRIFVDSLLKVKSFDTEEARYLETRLDASQNLKDLLTSTTSLLSGVTQLVGVVTLPKLNKLTLKHVEFLSLSPQKILAILVLNDRDVQNRIITTETPYSASQLEQVANYLNTHYVGKDLSHIKQLLAKSLAQDKEFFEKNSPFFQAMDGMFSESPSQQTILLEGETNLLSLADTEGLEKVQSLFQAFHEKQQVLGLLERCLSTEGIQIFIGEESGYQIFDSCSMVTSTYSMEGECVGVLGVIGPTRMNYERVINVVDVTARLLSAALYSTRK